MTEIKFKHNNMNLMQFIGVQVGAVICLPFLDLAFGLGKNESVLSVFLGHLTALWTIGILSFPLVRQSAMQQKNLIDFMSDVLGFLGIKIFRVVYTLVILGWFALQCRLVGEALALILDLKEHLLILCLLLSLSAAWIQLLGLNTISTVSTWLTPFLFVYLVYMLTQANLPIERITLAYSHWSSRDFWVGFFMSFAAFIGLAIDTPNFACSSRKPHLLAWVHALIFLIMIPASFGLILFLGFLSPSQSFILEAVPDKNSFFYILLACFLFAAYWTTNNANLYSASLSLFSSRSTEKPWIALILGCAATAFQFYPGLKETSKVINLVAIPVVIAGFLLFLNCEQKMVHPQKQLVAFLIGSFFGVSVHGELISSLSGEVLLDSVLASGAVLALLNVSHSARFLCIRKEKKCKN